MRFFLGFLLIVGLSCSGQKRTGSTEKGEMASPTKLKMVMQASYSTMEDPVFKVITGEKALKKEFARINRARKPGIPIPSVDFTKEALLLYGPGITEAAGNLELYIREENKDSLVIGIRQTANIPNTKDVATTPIRIYSIPLLEKKIIFSEVKE